MPPLTLPVVVRAGERGGVKGRGRLPAIPEVRCDQQPPLLLPAGNHSPGVVSGPNGLIDRKLSGEEIQKALLDRIALVMAAKFQLHVVSRRA